MLYAYLVRKSLINENEIPEIIDVLRCGWADERLEVFIV
jgi:hypothetical protein